MKNVVEASLKRASGDPRIDLTSPVFHRQLAAGMVARANLSLSRCLDNVLRPIGMTWSRYHVLSVVCHSEIGRVSQSAIADELCLHISSITGNVGRLVDDGHVVRMRLDNDRRTTYIAVTPAGKSIYELSRSRMEAVSSGMGDIPMEEIQALNLFLQKVIEASATTLANIGERDANA